MPTTNLIPESEDLVGLLRARGQRVTSQRLVILRELRRRSRHVTADEHVEDPGGELWYRRIEEIEAAASALCAHRYAVGHACWVGDPDEGVIVLPGPRLPDAFSGEGVIPPVPRTPLHRPA